MYIFKNHNLPRQGLSYHGTTEERVNCREIEAGLELFSFRWSFPRSSETPKKGAGHEEGTLVGYLFIGMLYTHHILNPFKVLIQRFLVYLQSGATSP